MHTVERKKPKRLTEEELVEWVDYYETLLFNVCWNDKAHLDFLVSGLAECRQELAFRGHVYRAI